MELAGRRKVCFSLPRVGALAAALALGGCASLGPGTSGPVGGPRSTVPATPSAPSAATSALRPPGAPTVAQPASPLRPFADVVRDAKRIDGLFTLWQKDDKVWIELKPADLEQPFFFSPKYKTGIGEAFFFGGLMGDDEGIVEFRRLHNLLQVVWRNTSYTAAEGTPEARAVAAAFSPSLLASAPVASAPHPRRGSFLVEANALFLADLPAVATRLQRRYRQGYAFDGRNSAILAARGTPDTMVLEVLAHYATGALATAGPGAPPGAPAPSVPATLPDARSLFITLHYALARLPAEPMRPRRADARIGHFTTVVSDFGSDLARTPRRHYVNRWRLEKQDPSASLSEPVKPIVFWLDRTVPERYRAAVTRGALAWNAAFERVGFKDVVRVEVQPDDADFDTLDFGRASIRWMTNASPSFGALGPHHRDPRTGEILDADIALESLSSRALRAVRSQVLTAAPAPGDEAGGAAEVAPTGRAASPGLYCTFAADAAEQAAYGLDVMEARGEIDPDSPEAQRFVEQYLEEVTAHEVGHALGLRHNFRASRAYTEAQLDDPAFTAEHGTAASVMDYPPLNLAAPGAAQAHAAAAAAAGPRGGPFNTALGPYDFWAVEYAYAPLAPDEEDAALRRIAARSADPLLAYGTDEDNAIGLDPESLTFDLGRDVVAFARKRIAIAQDLLARQERRTLRPDQDWALLRRSVTFAVRDVARAANVLVRQVGGVRTLRDAPGSGRDPLQPLPAAEQRQALDVLTASILSADALRVSPALQRRLGPDYLERRDGFDGEGGLVSTDFSLSQSVLDMQRSVLAALMNDATAVRLLDSAEKASPASPERALRVTELYAQLTRAVWSEIGSGNGQGGSAAVIAPRRRELQRDHVNRLAGLMLRPQAFSRADARGALRVEARALSQRLDTAAQRPGLDGDTRAHLQDSAETLRQALEAKLERVGV